MIKHLKAKYDEGKFACEVELVLSVMGGKWKPIILWHLGQSGTLRYGQLKRCIKKITPKILIQQLRELEQDGIVARKEYHQIPPKVEYSLTSEGEELIPILTVLCEWGKKRILGEEPASSCNAIV
ncbi:winged helix-turn-helix transcriptional regulator [Anaeroselena agilis]|uniref:Helix-turn-helix domain-containing protein n=1 Tax=Anaeroselena agilis TaxID=3063788 RepID=A0ABU3NUE9_9FIRM|nr:helix-turn-helix domain-containing protein [Selenomonadales bacterium 4137-cl]